MAKTERYKHDKAFETYCSLGPKRTYRQVAEHFGVSVSTIKAWARAENWRQRLQEREATVARQTADQVIGERIADATRKRKMVELALVKVLKAINAETVKVQVGDLDRLLRLQAYLDGDRASLNVETLRGQPIQEVAHVFMDWFRTLGDDERAEVIAVVQRREQVSGNPPSPPPESPPQRDSLAVKRDKKVQLGERGRN
jgi:transposase